jgi:heavy metal translocating P-type ATPase
MAPPARRNPALLIAALASSGIVALLWLRWMLHASAPATRLPLYVVLALGGIPLLLGLIGRAVHRHFGSDLLAGISIVTAALLGEYLAATLVILMLSGGEAMEHFAVGRASDVLQALARRMPLRAHRRTDHGIEDIELDAVRVGDAVSVFPHEICPVDGVVLEGAGVMDESYLTGEPFLMPKAPGTEVLSGSINGDTAIVVRAVRLAVDSRYARITQVLRESEQRRPRLRRLGDQLGAWYTPLALGLATGAWLWSGDPVRFLAVLVVATPCPLLIGIPGAIIGSISLAAKRGIIIRDPAVLERIDRCRTIILDKTGTLTYGAPALTDRVVAAGMDPDRVLQLAAGLERYSKHPLARPVLKAAVGEHLAPLEALQVREHPGEGLDGLVDGQRVRIMGRQQAEDAGLGAVLPAQHFGLECIVTIDGAYAATFRFHDVAREDGRSFVHHLGPSHRIARILLVSGDREQEVRYLAERVGITAIYAGQSPEEKVAITRAETSRGATMFIGDGINDAPALLSATVGVAFGHRNEVTSEAAGAVILETSLERVDELIHIAGRMRRIILQSVLGGMGLSLIGMLVAFGGYLPPVAGAISQEIIDLGAVLNALRAAVRGRTLSDYQDESASELLSSRQAAARPIR